MGYTTVFGGELLFPSQTSYLAITTAVDVALQWPIEQQIEGVDVVADFLDINTTAPALNIDFPDARNVSTGNKSTVNNVGGNAFTARDNTGGVIQFIGTGEQWVLVLTDNSTQAGIWSAFQLGAATTLASASALAGAGLQADGFGMLEQIIDSDVEAATPITVVDGDRAKCLVYTGGAGTADLPAAGTVGNNWFVMIRNSGSGTLNVLPPSGLIDGGASINLDTNDSAFFFTDGTDYFTIGLSSGSTIAFDFVSIAIPGSGDFVLSGANLNRISYRFTGALTGNRRIVVPNSTQQYWVDNQTSGAFTLEIDTAAGAGILVPQGQSLIVYCDATDVINATSSTSVAFPITIGQGGTAATTVGGAQINLQVPPESRLLTAGAGIGGGGDLTADRTFTLDVNSAATTPTPVVGDFFVFEDIDDNLTYKATIQDIVDLAGVTIEDEGVPLATLASILDFVGSGVVATGAGAEKTITINPVVPIVLLDTEQIRWGTGNDIQMAFDGSVTLEMNSAIAGGQRFHMNTSVSATTEFVITNSIAGFGIQVLAGSGITQFYNTLANGNLDVILMDFGPTDDDVLLRWGGSNAIRTRTVTGAYPHNQGGGGGINNSATGNGDARILSWYDQHFSCGDTQIGRNLTTTLTADDNLVSDDGGAPTLRVGRYKFEMFLVVRHNDTTTDFVFDFAGTNLASMAYTYEYRSADGTPSGSGASGSAGTNQTVDLGVTIGEQVFLHIRGQFDISSNGGILQFRWAPSANVIDDVFREAGAWMEIAAARIG